LHFNKIEEIKQRLISCYSVLPGSAEAIVGWSRKTKCHLTSYILGKIPATNYHNRLM